MGNPQEEKRKPWKKDKRSEHFQGLEHDTFTSEDPEISVLWWGDYYYHQDRA
jgi:hypothetical protein